MNSCGHPKLSVFQLKVAYSASKLCPSQLCHDLQLIPPKPSEFPFIGERVCFLLALEAFPTREINTSASPLATVLPEDEVQLPRPFPCFINFRLKKKKVFFLANTLKYGIFVTLHKTKVSKSVLHLICR